MLGRHQQTALLPGFDLPNQAHCPQGAAAVKSEGSYGKKAFCASLTASPLEHRPKTAYSKWASKISTSRSEGFATGTPFAPILNSRHKVGTRIPEKR